MCELLFLPVKKTFRKTGWEEVINLMACWNLGTSKVEILTFKLALSWLVLYKMLYVYTDKTLCIYKMAQHIYINIHIKYI